MASPIDPRRPPLGESKPLAAHWWTIAPNLIGRLRPEPVVDQAWSTHIGEGHRRVRIAGAFADADLSRTDGRDLYMIVHGLGGDAESPYMRQAAAAVQARGHASLRISMRGAGRSGPDFYHAGLADDLSAILRDPSLKRFERVFLIGFSLGGHISLHATWSATRDPRIAAVVAICSPLDMEGNARAFDDPRTWVYRRHVLGGLERIHVNVFGGPRPRFESIRAWDKAVVVPRWGFDSVQHYWDSQSSGPRLGDIELPVLFVATEGDPMVPSATLRPHLERGRELRGDLLDVVWLERGGHVGFPPKLDLGLPGDPGLMNQVLGWLEAR